jgi:hypothetical protein
MRTGRGSQRPWWLFAGAILTLGGATPAVADPEPAPKKAAPAARKPPAPKNVAASAPPEAYLTHEAWRNVSTAPLAPGEIDALLEEEFRAEKIEPSAEMGDEQFLRRVSLDLTGQLPGAAELEAFLASDDPGNRAAAIDARLEGAAYARHWARFWREAIATADAPNAVALEPQFEDWLCTQFQQNRSWGEIVRDLMTARGVLKRGEGEKEAAVFFLGRFTGPDGDIVRTAETSRLFLGIQIQCTQCHDDRRTGFWKQVQFHELAGFFARMQIGGSSGSMIKVESKKFGEHQMPDRKDAKLNWVTYPRFLDGQAPDDPAAADDAARRAALADYLTAGDNYWFSAAYVNRIWDALLGQAFYERVDDLGPTGEVVFPAVASRLAAAFRGSGHDTKALIRAIVNSKAYQRQVRLGETAEDHLRFAGVYPGRLRAGVLWRGLARVLGPLPENNQGLGSFLAEFDFDPSLRADEVDGTITQALWLLNSPVLNDRFKVQTYRPPPPAPGAVRPKGGEKPAAVDNQPRPTLLRKLLDEYGDDEAAVIRAVYLHTLARRPRETELATCQAYLRESAGRSIGRNEAFEDILKALVNSTEFQRKP